MNDRQIKELFSDARRADRETAPDFVSMKVAARERSRRSRSARAVRYAFMTGVGAVAIGAVAVWLAARNPATILPEPPPVVWEMAEPAEAVESGPAEIPEPEASPTLESSEDPTLSDTPSKPSTKSTPVVEALPEAPRVEMPPSGGTGGIRIHVQDAEGLPLPGATVTIRNELGYVKNSSLLTGPDGGSQFPVLRAGSGYEVQVAFPGFSAVRRDQITIRGGETVDVPVQMVSSIQEQVRLVAQREVVDLEKTDASARFNDGYTADLPVDGRFYQNVLTMAPGVQVGGNENSGVHGSRSRDFKALVGGVSNVDSLTGQSMSQVNPNSIEEMEVITAGEGPSFNTEGYAPIVENEFLSALENPLSTFSIDVDTASYANVRRFLTRGQLPPCDAVRIEELINYFSYDYPAPDGDAPFSASVEVAECPWNPDHRLARIGLKGQQVSRGDFAGSNLVFLIDVSGSMQPPNKLPLLKSALSLLVDQLDGRDQVAMVVYAGAAGVVLPSTSGDGKGEIQNALDRLRSGGSTNGGQGIELAYEIARKNLIPGGVNRVILATDGDFNVGTTDKAALLKTIKRGARENVFLTTLGFGMGNYKDDMLETLADKGNGNYAYIDTLREARKVLVEQIGGTLVTIAKDVKIQVEFNPAEVVDYRLIGYENRMLAKEDFNDDRKDAGEIGAGHTVTALYEIVPAGRSVPTASVDPLKYQQAVAASEAADSGELFTLKLRYKEPEAESSKLLSFPVTDDGRSLAAASADFKFASAVACFGMILRESQFATAHMLDQVGVLAREGTGRDESGYRAEFRQLVHAAEPLIRQPSTD